MRFYTYEKQKREDIEKRIKEYRATKEALQGLHKRGYRTINEAWRFVCKTQCTKRELDKFAALFGDKAESRKDSHSWDWFSKYGGSREVSIVIVGDSWRDNLKVLTFSVSEDLNIGRHYCANSLNVDDHTIEELINQCVTSIERNESALIQYDTVDAKIEAYEQAISDAVSKAYNDHLIGLDSIINSKSY